MIIIVFALLNCAILADETLVAHDSTTHQLYTHLLLQHAFVHRNLASQVRKVCLTLLALLFELFFSLLILVHLILAVLGLLQILILAYL